jgi:hypothetical protein
MQAEMEAVRKAKEEETRRKKAEMESRRKQEEIERLRQEEEDRKAALVLQVIVVFLFGCSSTELIIVCFLGSIGKGNPRRRSVSPTIGTGTS